MSVASCRESSSDRSVRPSSSSSSRLSSARCLVLRAPILRDRLAPDAVELLGDPRLRVAEKRLGRRLSVSVGADETNDFLRVEPDVADPLGERRMRVGHVRLAAQFLLQHLLDVLAGPGLRELLAHRRERAAWRLRLVVRSPIDLRPVLLVEIARAQRAREQCGHRRLRTGNGGRGLVGFELMRAAEREAVRVEPRHVPLEEPSEDARRPVPLLLETTEELPPRRADAIDPCTEASVASGEVAEFVRDHRAEFVG